LACRIRVAAAQLRRTARLGLTRRLPCRRITCAKPWPHKARRVFLMTIQRRSRGGVDAPDSWLGSSFLLNLDDSRMRMRAHSLTEHSLNDSAKALAIYAYVKRVPYTHPFKMGHQFSVEASRFRGRRILSCEAAAAIPSPHPTWRAHSVCEARRWCRRAGHAAPRCAKSLEPAEYQSVGECRLPTFAAVVQGSS